MSTVKHSVLTGADLHIPKVHDNTYHDPNYAPDADVIKKDGSVAFTGNQSLNSNKITSLASGTDAGDAVNKGQLLTSTSIANSATPAPTGGSKENEYYITALEEEATFAAPSGTPVNGNTLVIRVKDNGTARVLNWNAIYVGTYDKTLPTTTVLGKTMYLGFVYNSANSKWELLGRVDEA